MQSPQCLYTRIPPAPGSLSVFQRITGRRGRGCCLRPGPGSGLCALLEHSLSSSSCGLSCLRQLVRTVPLRARGRVRPDTLGERESERTGSGTQVSSAARGMETWPWEAAGWGWGVLGPEAPEPLTAAWPCPCPPLASQLPPSGLSFQEAHVLYLMAPPEGTLDGGPAPPRDLYLPSLLSSRPPGAQRSRTSEGSFCSSCRSTRDVDALSWPVSPPAWP